MHKAIIEQCEPLAPSKIGVELYFEACSLSSVGLQLIANMLDRIYASLTQQFAVRALNLMGQQSMDAEQLSVLVNISEKNREVYRIEGLLLHDILRPKKLTPASLGLSEQPELSRDRGNLLGATLRISDRITVSLQRAAQEGDRRQSRSSAVLAVARTRHFLTTVQEAYCWQQGPAQTVQMGDDPFDRENVAAFIKTLADPAGELIYRRGLSGEGAVHDELLLYTVKQDAQLYSTVEIGKGVSYTHDDEDVAWMEAFCQEDDWTCVVLPDIGLGWVTNDQILSTEHESIDRISHESAANAEWIFVYDNSLAWMLEYGGRYVSTITFEEESEANSILPAILRHCANLRHLTLLSSLSNDQIATSRERGEVFANDERVPALLDFRIDLSSLSPQAYASLRRALEVNKRLRFLKLQMPSRFVDFNGDLLPSGEYAKLMSEYEQIVEKCQGEVLPSALPVNQKMASLSALWQKSVVASTGTSTRCDLDSLMVASTFRFAAEHDDENEREDEENNVPGMGE